MRLSVVIPVFNEEESLEHLRDALYEALGEQTYNWQVVFVDDGSSDGSLSILETIAADDPEHIVVVAFRRNFGQTAAFAAGINPAEARSWF